MHTFVGVSACIGDGVDKNGDYGVKMVKLKKGKYGVISEKSILKTLPPHYIFFNPWIL